ncbi:hypothetical protein [Stieleria varia]|uniref:Uncharacterized protein n=1 Tax=Stieleria varia TaxID=2528005 RepID=A0A5C6A5M6_9BACT|nr:hypothetical protein [Stieleria varia]TWT94608.1 hypothetical protein Pla52n_54290 [Stieleria varia]
MKKSLKMQPTFIVELPWDAREAVSRIRRAILHAGFQDHAVSAGSCIDFRIDRQDQRFWSPHLSVQVSDVETGSQALGRFSPRPEIWTMFMAIYAVVATVGFGAAILGYVQWFLGSTPWAIALLPLGFIVIAALHMASLIGQSLSSDQMDLLRGRLDETILIAKAETPRPDESQPGQTMDAEPVL